MVDQRFKNTLEQDLKAEIKKSEDIMMADLRGQRVSKRFTEIMQERMNEIAQITDSQVLLTSTISLLRDSASILDDIILEANTSRREQQGRVTSLKDYYSKFLEIEKTIESEVQSKIYKEAQETQETQEAQEAQIDPHQIISSQQIRKVGERPEKLRDVRNKPEDLKGKTTFFRQK